MHFSQRRLHVLQFMQPWYNNTHIHTIWLWFSQTDTWICPCVHTQTHALTDAYIHSIPFSLNFNTHTPFAIQHTCLFSPNFHQHTHTLHLHIYTPYPHKYTPTHKQAHIFAIQHTLFSPDFHRHPLTYTNILATSTHTQTHTLSYSSMISLDTHILCLFNRHHHHHQHFRSPINGNNLIFKMFSPKSKFILFMMQHIYIVVI